MYHCVGLSDVLAMEVREISPRNVIRARNTQSIGVLAGLFVTNRVLEKTETASLPFLRRSFCMRLRNG